MPSSVVDKEEVAGRLWDARVNRRPLGPITADFPDITIKEAYRISEVNLKRRLREKKTTLAGKKIGLTSKAVQSRLKVDQPDFGYLTRDMAYDNNAQIPAWEFLQPRIEAEVAFFLKSDLKGPGVTREKVIAATIYVVPALEIIDSRIKDWKIKIADTVADNASSGAYVIGRGSHLPEDVDFPMLGMKMTKNGKIVSTGAGAACLGHPADAVAWLANAMGEYGVSLNDGDVVLSGALGPVTEVSKGDKIEAKINGLGDVSCTFS